VLSIPRRLRVFIDMRPFDMRGSFNSMAGRVRGLGQEPSDGHLYLFVSRNRKMAAVFLFDGSGWCQYRKRLQRGTFQLPDDVPKGTTQLAVEGRVLSSILDGIDLHAPRRRWFEKKRFAGS